MVDCQLLDLDSITQEERRLIVLHAVDGKGARPSDLTASPSYISKVRRGAAKVGEGLLCSALRLITPEELTQLLRGAVPFREATLADAVKVLATARVNDAFREQFLALLTKYLGDQALALGRTWTVTQGDVEEYVKAMRLRGSSEKNLRDRLRYVQRALAEMNWTLEPEGLIEYLAGLREESEHVARHASVSLKSFLKNVLRPRDPALFSVLYNSFTTVKPRSRGRGRLPTIQELRGVFNNLPTIEAKAYLALLAETGLRPGEPFLVNLGDVDWGRGLVRIGAVTATKRSFIAFLRPETVEWLRAEYLPRREEVVERMVRPIRASGWFGEDVLGRFRGRLLPFDRGRLRREVGEAARAVLGRGFELYELRRFFATWMVSRGVPESVVNTLQGRAPPSEFRVLVEHYWSPRHEELREWYLRHAPCLLCP
ncbi:integrase [Thermocladium modestius]|uniref:Integrase n=1 Tax=Thermocladium modestius TaxID=62609 RepID=A0A830GRR9_9CREN|nr:tyrosine-type recombinase/integrase [Thermocladium modestius]GGP19755.1 integrase [Thermocladium modestius]